MKSVIRAVKNHALSYADVEIKVREATSNDPLSPPLTLLRQLARATHDYNDYPALFAMVWKRLGDVEHVRHVTKALIVLHFLLVHGSDRFVQDVKRRARDISALTKYQHYDEHNVDDAKEARKKAKKIHSLLMDEALLTQERGAVKSQQSVDDGGEGELDGEEDGEEEKVAASERRANPRTRSPAAPAAASRQSRGAARDELDDDAEDEERPAPAKARAAAPRSAKAPTTLSQAPRQFAGTVKQARVPVREPVEDDFAAVSEEDLDVPAAPTRRTTVKRTVRKSTRVYDEDGNEISNETEEHRENSHDHDDREQPAPRGMRAGNAKTNAPGASVSARGTESRAAAPPIPLLDDLLFGPVHEQPPPRSARNKRANPIDAVNGELDLLSLANNNTVSHTYHLDEQPLDEAFAQPAPPGGATSSSVSARKAALLAQLAELEEQEKPLPAPQPRQQRQQQPKASPSARRSAQPPANDALWSSSLVSLSPAHSQPQSKSKSSQPATMAELRSRAPLPSTTGDMDFADLNSQFQRRPAAGSGQRRAVPPARPNDVFFPSNSTDLL